MDAEQQDRLEEARQRLAEQTISPVDREASQDALDAIAEALAQDDIDETIVREQIAILKKTAPAVATYMLREPQEQDAFEFRDFSVVGEPPYEAAKLRLQELPLTPVDREAVDEAIDDLRSAIRSSQPADIRQVMAKIKLMAPPIFHTLVQGE